MFLLPSRRLMIKKGIAKLRDFYNSREDFYVKNEPAKYFVCELIAGYFCLKDTFFFRLYKLHGQSMIEFKGLLFIICSSKGCCVIVCHIIMV